MSIAAVVWALRRAPVADGPTKLLLVALAERAEEDGIGAWPSVATLAAEACMSERTVQRTLRGLAEAGLIRESLRKPNARGGRVPRSWDLNLRRTWPASGGVTGDNPQAEGCQSTGGGVSPSDTRTVPTGTVPPRTVRPARGAKPAEVNAWAAAESKRITDTWWYELDPKPLQKWHVVRQIVRAAIKGGHEPDALLAAMRAVTAEGWAISAGTLTRRLSSVRPVGDDRPRMQPQVAAALTRADELERRGL